MSKAVEFDKNFHLVVKEMGYPRGQYSYDKYIMDQQHHRNVLKFCGTLAKIEKWQNSNTYTQCILKALNKQD